LLRELGARLVPTWAALESLPNNRTQLVVVERVARGGSYGDQEIADWVRDARRIAAVEHPNVARVRDVLIRGDEVIVATEYLDGAKWSELVARPIPLELTLRVFLDVLAGLSALHNLRDAKRQPLKLVHGELTPDCVMVGVDGIARIVGSCRAKSAGIPPGRAGAGYLAPEVLLADDCADARADLFSVGVMLWEALSGSSLFGEKAQASAIVTRLLGGHMPPATVPTQYPWAAPLAELVARALCADPQHRFASAPDMAAELRRIAGPKLAAPSRLAAHVKSAFGDRIRARREHLERAEARPPEVSRIEAQPPGRPDWRDSSSPNALTPVPSKPHAFVAGPVAPAPLVPQAHAAPPVPRKAPALEPVPVIESVTVVAAAPVVPAAPDEPPPTARPAALPPRPPGAAPLRPRLPTLAGVAPEAPPSPDDVRRPPVVVPSSNPPPPAVSESGEDAPPLQLPAAPRVPSDLAAAALALSASAPAPGPRSDARTSASTQASHESSSPRRAILWVAAVAVAASVLLFGWAALRVGAPPPRSAAAASSSPLGQSGVLRATAPPPGAVSPPQAPAAATTVAGAPASIPLASPPSKPQSAAPTEVVAPPNSGPARPAAPNSAPAVAPYRSNASSAPPRKSRPKYDPEGI
jgi:serine/threonine-protein kinase